MLQYTEQFNYTLTTSSQPWAFNNGNPLITGGVLRLRSNSYVNKAYNGSAYNFIPANNYHNNYVLKFTLDGTLAAENAVFNFMFYSFSGMAPNACLQKQSGALKLVTTAGYGFPVEPPGSGYNIPVFDQTNQVGLTCTFYYMVKTVASNYYVAVGVDDGVNYYVSDWVNFGNVSYPYLQMGSLNNGATGTAGFYYTVSTIDVFSELGESEIDNFRLTHDFAPVASPAGGDRNEATTVSLDYSIDPGANIYYTTNGDTPVSGVSTLYTGPFVVGSPFTPGSQVTVKAIANNGADSGISTIVYNYVVPQPVLTDLNSNSFQSYVDELSIGVTTPVGMTARYTINGATPTLASPAVVGGVITIPYSAGTFTLKVVNFYGSDPSSVASQACSFLVASVVAPPSGVYPSTISVDLTCVSPDSDIYYTLDGSEPTLSSSQYNTPITIAWNPSTSTVLRAVAYSNAIASSSGFSEFTYTFQVASPVVTPGNMQTGNPIVFSASCETPSASIFYTLDGSIPSAASEAYLSQVTVQPGTFVQAIAFRNGFYSGITSVLYDFEYHSTTPAIQTLASREIKAFYQRNQNYNVSHEFAPADGQLALTYDSASSSDELWLTRFDVLRNQYGPQYVSTMGQTCVFESLSYFQFMRSLTGSIALELSVSADANYLWLVNNQHAPGYTKPFLGFWYFEIGSYSQALKFQIAKSGANQILRVIYDLYGSETVIDEVTIPTIVLGTNVYFKIEYTSGVFTFSIATSAGNTTVPGTYTVVTTTSVVAEGDWWARNVMDLLSSPNPTSTQADGGFSTLNLVYNWYKVSATSSRWLKTPAGITMSSKADRDAGTRIETLRFDEHLDRMFWITSYDGNSLSGYGYDSQDRANLVEYSERFDGIVLRHLVDFTASDGRDYPYILTRYMRFTGDFEVVFNADFLLTVFQYIPNPTTFRFTLQSSSQLISIDYVANYGSDSKFVVSVDGVEVGASVLELHGDLPTSAKFKFVRTGGNVFASVSYINDSFVALATVASNAAYDFRLEVSAESQGLSQDVYQRYAAVILRSIDYNATNVRLNQSTNVITLHGCYFKLNNIGHGWEAQSLTLPLSSTGLVVYSKSTKAISVLLGRPLLDQDQIVLVGIFATNASGLDYYTPVFNSSLICSRTLTEDSEVYGSENILACGSNLDLNKISGIVSWNSNGFIRSKSVEDNTYEPSSHSYYGFANYRVVRVKETSLFSLAFHAKEL